MCKRRNSPVEHPIHSSRNRRTAGLADEPFVSVHDPVPNERAHTVSGHIHPTVRLDDPTGDRLRFVVAPTRTRSRPDGAGRGDAVAIG